MSVRFVIEPLAKAHKRADFTSGNDRIDSYFRETVSQDVKRKYATCFVASEIATNKRDVPRPSGRGFRAHRPKAGSAPLCIGAKC